MTDRGSFRESIGLVIGAGALIGAFWAVGVSFRDGFALDLGSLVLPAVRHVDFMFIYSLLGTMAVVLLGLGIAGLVAPHVPSLVERWGEVPDRRWVVLVSFLTGAVAFAVRYQLLDEAPLTDDESAYRFSAELLASGRLWAESPPLKLFFDRAFMINDGRLYSQYPLGWPALMVPGVLVGLPGLMNPIYAALTVPPVFLVLRRVGGSSWAKVGAILIPLAPMLMVGAATEMAHTSCLMVLAWQFLAVFRSRDEGAPWWVHAVVAALFSVGVFIRPATAVGIGLPMLVFWAMGLRRRRGRGLAAALAAFAIPAAAMGGLFLLVNDLQNGSPFTPAYQRVLEYSRENGFRYSNWLEEPPPSEQVVGLHLGNPARGVAVTVAGMLRLNADLFGWPLSLLFVAFALGLREARLFWASAASFCAVLFFSADSGIDTFGPVHYFELALPVVCLSTVGLKRATAAFDALRPGDARLRALPLSMLAASVVLAAACFLPVRWGAIRRIAEYVNMPRDAVERANIHDAVIFVNRGATPSCHPVHTRHWVFWRPNNDPDLQNDVLWVNHLTVEDDRRLMDHFPRRRGYIGVWTTRCRFVIADLSEVSPGQIPDGFVGGTGAGLDGQRHRPFSDETRPGP